MFVLYAVGFGAVIALISLWLKRTPTSTVLQRASSLKNEDKKPFEFDTVSIPALKDFDVATTEPYPYQPWKSGKFVMTMGIKKLPQGEWLLLDNKYWEEQKLRRYLLQEKHDAVMQILPGSEAACAECLKYVVSFMKRRFPHLFFHPMDKPDYIHNALTGKTFRITEPYEQPPLEVAAQLAMEDLNLLIQGFGDDPNQHYLAASYSMGPAGWYLEERIGWPLYKIHAPVPLWEEKLRRSVERAFLKMKSEDLISRHNFFMQTTDVMFQQEPFASETPVDLPKIEDIRIRHERQTLRRLPKTGAIMFTVRTYLKPVLELSDEPESCRELLGAVRAMHPDMARYKGRQIWGEVLEPWCEERLAEAGLDLPVIPKAAE